VQSHLYGVRLHAEHFADLARAQIGAVPHRDQLAAALVEPLDCIRDDNALHGLALQVLTRRLLAHLRIRKRPAARQRIVDATAGDSKEPRQRTAARVVIARAVPQCTLEHFARHVLGVGPITEAVGDVRVDAPDQGRRVRERVLAPHLSSL
jgi:hypothetical protein